MKVICHSLLDKKTKLAVSKDSARRTGIETQQLAPAIMPISGIKPANFSFLFIENIIDRLEVTKMEIISPKTILYNDKSAIKLGGMKKVKVGLNTKDKPRPTRLGDDEKGLVNSAMEGDV